MSKRDTQFAGFAEKLSQEIHDMAHSFTIFPGAHVLKRMECEIIAKRAYDLVEHAIYRSGLMEHDWRITTEAVFNAIPDLTEWPKEQEEGTEGKEKES